MNPLNAIQPAPRVFLISPAKLGGPRSTHLLNPESTFELAVRLRSGSATLGESYSFISALYFRGKLAYAEAFSAPPQGVPPVLVIVPGLGLVPPGTVLDADQLRRTGAIAVDEANEEYTLPLLRDAEMLHQKAGLHCRYLLLGSVATLSTRSLYSRYFRTDCCSRLILRAAAI